MYKLLLIFLYVLRAYKDFNDLNSILKTLNNNKTRFTINLNIYLNNGKTKIFFIYEKNILLNRNNLTTNPNLLRKKEN